MTPILKAVVFFCAHVLINQTILFLRTKAYSTVRNIMTPNTPSQTPSTPHHPSRRNLLESTFWQVLPTYYDKIDTRWTLIASLYHEASAAVMATDRAAGVNSLKAELEMLESDIKEYRAIVRGIEMEDLVGLYVVAGRQRWRAEQIAKEDLEGFEEGVKEVEERVREVRAELVYGFEGQ